MMPRMPHEPLRIPTLPSRTFRVPPQLEGLRRIAYNLWWTWHPQAKDLFRRVDSTAWQRYRSPIAVLAGSPPWDDLLSSPEFMAEYRQVLGAFDAYMENGSDSWFGREYPRSDGRPIAYFCAEYGFDESLGIYSGGLGILAGDHTKAASDMALPFVAIGLLYRRGYFRQTIDADGHQEHAYPNYDLSRLPVQQVIGPDGDPLRVQLELPGRNVTVGVWCLQVGRVPVLLLDTDLPENHQSDRPITHILYVRGREMRLYQEVVLGVGGVRAIRALGIDPAVWHLNEGHSAFLLCERAREFVAAGVPLDEAFERVRATSVFTIHTPVSAGNERFETGLVRRVAGPLLERASGSIPIDHVLELGQGVDRATSEFDMTAFSLRLSRAANAVSQLHARTANQTWEGVTPRPILGITNGVHVPSWVGDRMRDLDQRYLGADLDNLDRRSRGTPVLGARRPHPGPRALGCAPAAEARADAVRAGPAAQPVRPARRVAGGPRAARARARPVDLHDRLRPPVRDVQARGPAVRRRGPPGATRERRAATGPDSSSPARRIRPTVPASR